MNMDPEFIPPPIPGYRFASNYGASHIDTGEVFTLESVRERAASWLEVPVEDVLSINFRVGEGFFAVRFATYVKEEHREKVEYKRELIDFLLDEHKDL